MIIPVEKKKINSDQNKKFAPIKIGIVPMNENALIHLIIHKGR